MIKKEVKEYNGRQRIELNKKDNLDAGAKIIILSENEYNQLLAKINDYDAVKKENQILHNQENNLKKIVDDVTAPIYDQHQKELTSKDQQIKQLQIQLKALQTKTNQYNLDMQGLNVIDIAVLRKHKKLIADFNTAIADVDADAIIDADAKKLE